MTPEGQQRRHRVDAIITGIKRGSYDDKLKELREAIDERNRERQDHVVELVQEVFGPDYTVTTHRSNEPITRASPLDRPKQRTEGEGDEGEPGEGPLEPEPLGPEPEKVREEDMEIESRGAQIGGVPGGPTFG